ncbi:MAG TPA: hypothetical protein VFV99_19195 [Kofleriaceae bacterium]|nr:hypothetical protein [Kofleriaceae bacterium]
MRQLAICVGFGLVAGCTISTGEEPPTPPSWGVPLTGGTMTVTRDGNRAIVSDPDRDRVVIVDLVTERVADTIALPAHSEPGRAIDDGGGRIHVALRGSGELLTITGADHIVRPICGEPRGLAWQETGDLVHVACATGELVSVPAGGGDPVRVLHLDRDLRDVLVQNTGLVVTTFRTAQVIKLDDQGAIVSRITPTTTTRFDFSGESGSFNIPAVPEVAWRTIALPDGSLAISHQRRLGTTLRIITGGYGGQCGGAAVESNLTIVRPDGTPFAVAPIVGASLPVDLAVSPTNGDLAVVSVGHDTVFVVPSASRMTPDMSDCSGMFATPLEGFQVGSPTSVAYRPNGALLIFYPEADGISILDGNGLRGLSLGDRPRNDVGRTMFHSVTESGLACASCHPEARDDGGVWTFDKLGKRRTQNLGGGILGRAPYHWGADMPSLHILVDDVFTNRMGGEPATDDQVRSLAKFLDRVPAPRGVVLDPDAVARGQALFDSSETGCRSCHNGALFTNNTMATVGTGMTVKVPSLIGVGGRAPYMHDGCAATLRDRFGTCGGGAAHGNTGDLSEAQLGDLIAYLQSL